VAITIDGEFVVHDIKVIEGDDHLYIAMPSRQSPDGVFRDIAHPINAAVRERVQDAVLKKYREVVEESE
ncbi:MAG: SpoVG family protein, partial [Lachnospiraceae bacterium]|nr:SpoVG family protein [Lachnospiraceae bacterium]